MCVPHQDMIFLFNEGRRGTTRSVLCAKSLLENLSSLTRCLRGGENSRALDGTISEDELLNRQKYLSGYTDFYDIKESSSETVSTITRGKPTSDV